MPYMSYAQNREDVLLQRAFPGVEGFYVDIGAADPIELSVTKLFYDRGWCGINVEPQNYYYNRLVADRPRDINLQMVISNESGLITFQEMPETRGWSSVDPATIKQLSDRGCRMIEHVVPAIRLEELLDQQAHGHTIDFLKVDVEGHEFAVLASGNFQKHRPRVILVEATEVGRPEQNHQQWEPILLSNGYFFATFDGLNRFYVRHEDEPLLTHFQIAPNVFDDYKPYEWYQPLANAEAKVRELQQLQQELYIQLHQLHDHCDNLQAVNTQLESYVGSMSILIEDQRQAFGSFLPTDAKDSLKGILQAIQVRVSRQINPES